MGHKQSWLAIQWPSGRWACNRTSNFWLPKAGETASPAASLLLLVAPHSWTHSTLLHTTDTICPNRQHILARHRGERTKALTGTTYAHPGRLLSPAAKKEPDCLALLGHHLLDTQPVCPSVCLSLTLVRAPFRRAATES